MTPGSSGSHEFQVDRQLRGQRGPCPLLRRDQGRDPVSLCFCKHLAFSQGQAGGAQRAGEVGRESGLSFLRFLSVSVASTELGA